MNVHGVYDTSATMQSFFSREEYQQSLEQQSGMAGSLFGFYGGVKKAWGSSSVSGSQKYLSVFSIDIDRCAHVQFLIYGKCGGLIYGTKILQKSNFADLLCQWIIQLLHCTPNYC